MNELRLIENNCLEIQKNTKKYIDRIQLIGLNFNLFYLSNYFSKLIDYEKNEKKAGWKIRINEIKNLENVNETIKNIIESPNEIKEFIKFQEILTKNENDENNQRIIK